MELERVSSPNPSAQGSNPVEKSHKRKRKTPTPEEEEEDQLDSSSIASTSTSTPNFIPIPIPIPTPTIPPSTHIKKPRRTPEEKAARAAKKEKKRLKREGRGQIEPSEKSMQVGERMDTSIPNLIALPSLPSSSSALLDISIVAPLEEPRRKKKKKTTEEKEGGEKKEEEEEKEVDKKKEKKERKKERKRLKRERRKAEKKALSLSRTLVKKEEEELYEYAKLEIDGREYNYRPHGRKLEACEEWDWEVSFIVVGGWDGISPADD